MIFECILITDEELDALYKWLKVCNNTETKKAIVMGFIPTASNIASKYHRTTSVSFEDLQGEAILGLISAVDRLSVLEHDNPGGYITTTINGYCLNFIKKQLFRPLTLTIDKGEEPFDIVQFKDKLDFIIHNEEERKIITMRLDGKNDNEIAEVLGCTRRNVSLIREKLFRRFNRV